MRHELKSTHKYYRIGGLPLALQIWIFECCSKVDEDIAIRVADSIPRILNWKTIAESPWLKYIVKCLFMPTKNKVFVQSQYISLHCLFELKLLYLMLFCVFGFSV